ncbi:MAG: hypothetical protein CM15mP70_00740 [Pelagibacteraceae bacterium]|nr:MAG: hypothetical protein CM15mP70_00740 [Pelagibacteraceae bacterium]
MSDQNIIPRLPLFTPGCNISFLDKAIAKGAESVIVDLEDAVAPERKEMARDNLQKFSIQSLFVLMERTPQNLKVT